jgi:tRNA threonylcarbamoyladenosine modification (KEOPS) complex  Pcc1 subunit
MKAQAVIRLKFPSQKLLAMMLKALEPEAKSMPTPRSRVQIVGRSKELTLKFEAKDTAALRAAVNSYLRWVALINETCSVLQHFEEDSRRSCPLGII